MKSCLFFIFIFSLLSLPVRSQTVIREGSKRDTIIKTKEIQQTVRTTPNGQKVSNRNITPDRGKWSIGGAYGMAFGDQTTINIVPQVTYSQSTYFAIGGGLSYSYFYRSDNKEKEKMNYFGLNIFARINPLRYLSFQVQPEVLQRWGKQNNRKVTTRTVPTLLAGGGFIIPAGPGGIQLMFFYDLIQDKYTPYGNGLYIAAGYSFSF